MLDKVILENGLVIYLYQDLRRHSTFFNFITKCGGYNKDFILDGKEYHIHDGIHHILEHYIVECNDKGNFLKDLGEASMSTNAQTSLLSTEFYFSTVENVSMGINRILEAVNEVSFDSEKLEKLKNPICQEIRGKMDNKFYHEYKLRMNNLFHSIKYRDIGGSVDEVMKTTIDELETLYNAFYKPSNQVIVVAGNFNKDEVLNTKKDYYKNHKVNTHESSIIKIDEKKEINKKSDILYFPTPKNYTELVFKIDISNNSPKQNLDLDFYIGCFLSQAFGNTSKIYKDLIDRKIITNYINCGNTIMGDYLIISIGSYTDKPLEFRKEVLDTIKNKDFFNEEKFELEKKSCIIRMILRDDSVMSTITPFIENLIYYDYPYLDKVDDLYEFSYDKFIEVIKNMDFSNYIDITIKEKED